VIVGSKRHARTLRHNEEKDGEVKRLKGIIRRLESDKRKLLSELKTLEDAFGKSITHIKGKLDKTSVEDVIKSVNKGQRLHEVTPAKEHKDWTCHKCKNGNLELVTLSIRNGEKSFRICSNKKCKYRPPIDNNEYGDDK